MTIEEGATKRRRRRSKAWFYYAGLTVLSFCVLCTGQLIGLVGMALFGLYSFYLYRGGRFVFWFW